MWKLLSKFVLYVNPSSGALAMARLARFQRHKIQQILLKESDRRLRVVGETVHLVSR